MKKTLNRILLSILFVVVSIMASACGNTGGADGDAANQAQIQLETEIADAKQVYSSLRLAKTYCDGMSSAVVSAWYYAIYYADDELDAMVSSGSVDTWDEYIVDSFWYHTDGMSSRNTIRTAMTNAIGGSSGAVWAQALSNISYAVGVAQEYNKLDGLNETKKCLEETLSLINKLTEKNKASTHKEELVELYAAINSYLGIIESPSGTYNSYSTSISNNKTDITNKINRLNVYFG